MKNKQATIILSRVKKADLPFINGDIIAVDYGCSFALRHHLPIKQAIGDFDSLKPKELYVLKQKKVPLLTYSPMKDQADGEIALEWAVKQPYTTISVVGFSEGRLDHYQALLQVLWRLKQPHLSFVSALQKVSYLPRGEYDIKKTVPFDVFSIFTFSEANITIESATYPLSKRTITAASTMILSNQWQSRKPITLRVHSGECLLFLSKGF